MVNLIQIKSKTKNSINFGKCIASWLCVLNVLGLVFDSKLTCIVFESIFLTKLLVNLMWNFSGFWLKSILHSNKTPRYFGFKLCATKLSTDRVFICGCSSIFRRDIQFFAHFFCILGNLGCMNPHTFGPIFDQFSFSKNKIIQSQFSLRKINICGRDKIR